MTFCVECGREGPTLGGLCEDDFVRKHPPVRGPEHIDMERCAHCGKLHIGGRWEARTLEDVMLELIGSVSERDPHVTRARFTYVM